MSGSSSAVKQRVAAVAEQAGLRFVDFDVTAPHPAAADLLPADVARACAAVVVAADGVGLTVAMANPGDAAAVRAVEAAVGVPVTVAVAERNEVAAVVEALYGSGRGGGVHVDELLGRVLDLDGSDLHLTAGSHPVVRVHGALRTLTEYPVLDAETTAAMVGAILDDKQRARFHAELELDTSYTLPGRGRFRVNVFRQRDALGAVMRAIPFEVVPLADLGLPPVVAGLADLTRGLVLVTGPTGSGKSTTLASLIDRINTTRPVHIVTVEDPIEFLHSHKQAIVNQREVGADTFSFAAALKHVLRQDPDVILVGEMRDLETIATAITAAETGHLVFATLHTQDAPQSVDRIIDVFPPHQQQQVRVQLASSLQAVVTQQLVPKAGGGGRAVAVEVLVVTPAVRNLIREGKTHQIASSMQTGGKQGMQTMDQALATLVKSGAITREAAAEKAANPDDLARLGG